MRRVGAQRRSLFGVLFRRRLVCYPNHNNPRCEPSSEGNGIMRYSWRNALKFVLAITAASASGLVTHAWAQNYPVKGIRVIVGFATGGGTDTEIGRAHV